MADDFDPGSDLSPAAFATGNDNVQLHIGIDARLLSRPITGIGRYTLEICKELSKLPNLTLTLYSPSPIQPSVILLLGNSTVKQASLRGDVLRFLWGETYLPWMLRRDQVDVYWNPAHRIPIMLTDTIASVVSIHDLVWRHHPETMRYLLMAAERQQMPYAVRKANQIVAVSESTRTSLIHEFGIAASKCTTIYHGVSDSLKVAKTSCINDASARRYILFVGTIEPRKNIFRLLRAFKQALRHTGSPWQLLLAGGRGWGEVEIEDMIESLELQDAAKYLGYVSDQQLSVLYANCEFLAMPSLYEGFGLPLLEAMGHGKPVLTSQNSSMEEIGSAAGVLVDPLGTCSIARGIVRLMEDEELRKKLARLAVTEARKYSWYQAAGQLVAAFARAKRDVERSC